VVAVLPEPTPYRSPLFDLLAQRSDLDLIVVYAAEAIARNRWRQSIGHPHVILRGLRLPGAHLLLRHDYPVTPGIFTRLARARPDCAVITGWSTFASQAAIAWCCARHVPFVLQVESHDYGPRSRWRRLVKGLVVPRIVRRAGSMLVTGALARRSLIARGADPARIRVFANTVDVRRFAAEAERRREHRAELRGRLGLASSDVAVLSVARLAPEKGLDTLLRAAAATSLEHIRVVIAGTGPERQRLEALGGELGLDAVFLGHLDREALTDAYAACDVFALLSRHEPWAVVVNEAAACGLPLVLSDRVGAAYDLLEDGVNGVLVPADDVTAASKALVRLVGDPDFRRRAGERSAEIAAGWGYEPSVEAFMAAVREAVGSKATAR
jgi:glycosyltransferase involved in cell wall biosynthesis